MCIMWLYSGGVATKRNNLLQGDSRKLKCPNGSGTQHASTYTVRCWSAYSQRAISHLRVSACVSRAKLRPTMQLNIACGRCVQHIRHRCLLLLHLSKDTRIGGMQVHPRPLRHAVQ